MNRLIAWECNKIAEHYGEEPQLKMMIEECAELTQAICKLFRDDRLNDRETRAHYVEELADVTIVAEQLFLMLSDEEKQMLKDSMRFKLRRQLKRIKGEKEAAENEEAT